MAEELAPARNIQMFDGVTMDCLSPDAILAAKDAQPPSSSGFAPPTARQDAASWQEKVPDRGFGCGLSLRESLGKVLEVSFVRWLTKASSSGLIRATTRWGP